MRRIVDGEDASVIAAIREGDTERFAFLVAKYQPRVFATARRYARRQDEVEDIAQEVFIKAFERLDSFRGDAPFEHWLMRLAVRTCFDFLRRHQRSREDSAADLSPEVENWIEAFAAAPEAASADSAAAQALVAHVLEHLSPAARMVITLLEIEERSVREIAELTGWSQTLVKVRAFRARAEMRKVLARLAREKYL